MIQNGKWFSNAVMQNAFVLFVLRFYGTVNSQGYVQPVSYPLTLFLDRLRHTKRLTST